MDWLPGVGLLRRLWEVGVFRVKGRSMEPAFREGDFLFVWGGYEGLRRGDVVVFSHPSVEGRMMLKRVLGLPGEWVRLEQEGAAVDTGGDVPEDDEALGMSWTLGKDEWFVVGDNAEVSLDSRRLGPIRGSWIRGRVWFRYWPLLRFGGESPPS